MGHLHEWISELQIHRNHYTRGSAPMRQYMDQNYTVPNLYNLYFHDMTSNKLPAVSSNKFTAVFKTDYNIVPR